MPALTHGVAEPAQPRAVPLWFALAIAPMVASEIARLAQPDVFAWIACDYGGRLAALAVLVAVPAARRVALRPERIRIPWWEAAAWIVAIAALVRLLGGAASDYVNGLLPGTAVGHYPAPRGALYVVDVSFGLALVAYSEELIFRRCGRHALGALFGDGAAMVVATAALFAAYHWWTGAGNIVTALLFGVLAMVFYKRAGALAPVVLAHYLCDVMLAVWAV
ncbi:MAG TPA: CPBP family intramembrane glutamic endopeptidase [Xanthobacteraceae bacterium]|nr:CPBP family intramembrane glutamic endopeptidase [Xanthobacteraceae bacterium]